MRYFYDTEFIEDGKTIELVSIGIVSQEGKTYYACSSEFDGSRANPWVRKNVLDKLPSASDEAWKTRETIRDEVAAFLLEGATSSKRPELWAWVGGYDHVVYAQLFGDMKSMPKLLPRFTHELKQYWEFAGRPTLPPLADTHHNALTDACHARAVFELCDANLPLNRWGSVGRKGRIQG